MQHDPSSYELYNLYCNVKTRPSSYFYMFRNNMNAVMSLMVVVRQCSMPPPMNSIILIAL